MSAPDAEMPARREQRPDVPPRLAGRGLSFATIVTFFGPGAIIASLSVGSGETVLASRMGAVFGYTVWGKLISARASVERHALPSLWHST